VVKLEVLVAQRCSLFSPAVPRHEHVTRSNPERPRWGIAIYVGNSMADTRSLLINIWCRSYDLGSNNQRAGSM
jgi:hypothetical protein